MQIINYPLLGANVYVWKLLEIANLFIAFMALSKTSSSLHDKILPEKRKRTKLAFINNESSYI